MVQILADLAVRLLFAALAIAPLSGCYLVQAAAGQADVLSRSRPIERAVADPRTAPEVRERLQLAQQARDFAVRELGLPDGRSFRKYAELGRPYAVWNVVATPEFSVEPRRWCFPVVGCLAYRGYFEREKAEAKARRLARRGDDVTVGGVATYSTLGHLPDPVFDTMLRWPETRLVGTIFHELAHERLYAPGATEFNEAFASVVEQEGVRRWLALRGRAAEIERYEQVLVREAQFAALLRAARARLAKLFDSGRPAPDVRIEKQREFGRLKFDYERLRERWGGYAAYDGWFARVLNNAHLASVATYQDCVPGLRAELDAAGSLPVFYERAARLGALPEREWRAAVCAVPVARARNSAGPR